MSMVGMELNEAVSTGDFDSLEEMLSTGKFDVNLGDEDWGNKTPLHWAAQKGYVECIRLLLEYGANGNARTDTGWTPAHFAAESGRVTALRALYSANIPLDRKDIYDTRPSRLAEIYGHTECMKYLYQVEKELAEKRTTLGLTDISENENEEEISEKNKQGIENNITRKVSKNKLTNGSGNDKSGRKYSRTGNKRKSSEIKSSLQNSGTKPA